MVPASDRREKRGRPPATFEQREGRALTKRQQAFVREWCSQDGQITKRDAAIAAGFAASSAHQRAYEMTNPDVCPHVCKAIRLFQADLDKKYAVNYGRHVKDLQRIRDEALENGAYSAAVQAEKSRGQTAGLYVTKTEIRHGSIDQMDREQVMKALEELKAQYEPVATVERIDSEKETVEEEAGVELLEAAIPGDKKAQAEVETH
jgi:phage terminase small subunit|tara:strand:+ start:1131 stop:1745 length:615 start_codon:yes stop_codon:yes gene_type:complete